MKTASPAAMPKRNFCKLVLSAALVSLTHGAWAQAAYPSQPIKIIVPFGAGGLGDITIRLVGQKLSERLGQQVVVENKPGAGGIVAAKALLAAPKDGHTLILFSNGTTIAKSLFKLDFDPETDFAPISSVAYFDLILVVGKDSPVTDLKSLLDLARQRSLNLGSINPGSTQNLSASLFKSVAKINATVVPFKNTPEVLTAAIRNDIDLAFESYAALKGAVQSGQVRVLATTGPTRAPWLPNVPTVMEAGLSGYEVTGWNALYGPASMPAGAVATLNRHVQEVMALPEVKNRLIELGTGPGASTPAEMAAIFKRDTAKWAQIIQQANIKAQ